MAGKKGCSGGSRVGAGRKAGAGSLKKADVQKAPIVQHSKTGLETWMKTLKAQVPAAPPAPPAAAAAASAAEIDEDYEEEAAAIRAAQAKARARCAKLAEAAV